MKKVEPEVFLIAKTELIGAGASKYFKTIGDPNWEFDPNVSDMETLVEMAGRLCYRSWQSYDPAKPECSNPNVTKVREGNDVYISNLLKSHHGSVLEHVSFTFILHHVSRVLTHELVRHRVGMAYSQESLRYVRLSKLNFWFPPEVGKQGEEAIEYFEKCLGRLELMQKHLQEIFDIKNIKKFSDKKKLTSMFRRLAPLGLATTIMFTANVRAIRHIIAQRTSMGAEVEIREVFGRVAEICKSEAPNLFSDMAVNDGVYSFDNEKV